MILLRFRNDHKPKSVFHGSESGVIDKIHELELTDHHDAFFYKRGKFENLGLNPKGTYDYYLVCENGEDMEKHIKDYEDNVLKK
tara:strand:- start:11792 stop:12043 length:252 start_codon:yes stop_codon:yes gene_type:complete